MRTPDFIAMSYQEAAARARVMKALGHPVRLLIVDALHKGDRCICELAPQFKIRQPTLSRHINVLRQAGLISERRIGPKLMLHLITPCIVRAFDCALEVVQSDLRRRSRVLEGTKS